MKPTDEGLPPPRGPEKKLPHGAPPEPAGSYDDGVPHHQPGVHDELHHADVAHEHSDVDVRAIATSAGIVAGVVAVSMLGMYLLFGWFEHRALRTQPFVSPLAPPATEMPPNTAESPFFSHSADGVQLLTNEFMALEQHRATERERLHSYGWVDEAGGVAHIPIEEAKRLIVERGLPAREFDPVDPTLGTRRPAMGGSSSGRVITGVFPEPDAAGDPAADEPPSEDQAAPPAGAPTPQGSGR